MNLLPTNIIPLSEARGKLGELTDRIKDDQFIVFTKGGKPKAALVDINYLQKLEADVVQMYGKTFINPSLLPYSREFTDEELAVWQKEDQL